MNVTIVGTDEWAAALAQRLKATGNRANRSTYSDACASNPAAEGEMSEEKASTTLVVIATSSLTEEDYIVIAAREQTTEVVWFCVAGEGEGFPWNKPARGIVCLTADQSERALAGELHLLVGGDAEAVRRLEPLWMQISRAYAYCGDQSMPEVIWCAAFLHQAVSGQLTENLCRRVAESGGDPALLRSLLLDQAFPLSADDGLSGAGTPWSHGHREHGVGTVQLAASRLAFGHESTSALVRLASK